MFKGKSTGYLTSIQMTRCTKYGKPVALLILSNPIHMRNTNLLAIHKAIIDRFGRYPHRNTILGRTSTAEELAFLSEPGSSF